MNSMKVKKGDKVQVIAGKDKGKQGTILRSVPTRNRVVVEGCGIVKKAVRPTQQNPQGGIISMEAPIHVSNVSWSAPLAASRFALASASTTRAKRSASARSAAKTSTRNSPPVE